MNDSSLFESSGMAHMNAAHNSLFAVPDSTLEIAINNFKGDNLSGLSSGLPASISGWGVGMSTVPFDLSTDASSEGRNLGDDSSALTTSEDPDAASYGIALTCTVGAGIGIAASSPDGDGPIILFFKNDKPNSYVEKNAAMIYNSLHGNSNKSLKYPAVISESPDGFETASKVFSGKSFEKIKDILDIWEYILEEHVQNDNSL